MLDYRKIVGKNVRALRDEMGISQEELGFRSNLDRTYVSGVERGVRNPTVMVLARLAAALNTEPSALLVSCDGNWKGSVTSFVSKFELGERRLDVAEFIQISNAIGADPIEIIHRAEVGWWASIKGWLYIELTAACALGDEVQAQVTEVHDIVERVTTVHGGQRAGDREDLLVWDA